MEVNNRVKSLVLNYLPALFCSGDFTLVYYQMEKLEYFSKINYMEVQVAITFCKT